MYYLAVACERMNWQGKAEDDYKSDNNGFSGLHWSLIDVAGCD
jgi:hypothetical protein